LAYYRQRLEQAERLFVEPRAAIDFLNIFTGKLLGPQEDEKLDTLFSLTAWLEEQSGDTSPSRPNLKSSRQLRFVFLEGQHIMDVKTAIG
jgi:hypothetical protein